MAEKRSKKRRAGKTRKASRIATFAGGARLWVRRAVLGCVLLVVLGIGGYAIWAPPTTPYIVSERLRLGAVRRAWVDLEAVAPVMARAVVAAEDANFCEHWGFDMGAIRAAIRDGEGRGASTLSQQVVKNVYLWQGRNWARKALEAALTPMVELVWSKRRILEVYLNVAEFDEGVFGVAAASRHYYGVSPKDLTATQAATLAALLPNPRERSAARPSPFVRRRAAQIADGAATIRADGRAACFEP